MQIRGKLYEKFDTQQVTDSFRKREFVIEFVENPTYPQYVLFQLIQDRVNLIDPIEKGTMVDVEFNLRGRQWKSPQGEMRYFNSLEAWRLSAVESQVPGGDQVPPPVPPPDVIDVTDSEGDDLPF